MARHQASMSQHNKVVCVTEWPTDLEDSLPLPQAIKNLRKAGRPPFSAPLETGKTVLPLLWKIDTDVDDHLMGDTMRLTQILLNLCSNAVKFTKKGGISVKIKRYVPVPVQHHSGQMTFKQRYDAKMETIWTRAMRGKSSAAKMHKDKEARAGASDDEDENEDCSDKTILEISVTDTGIGIPADRLPRLFKSFSQIDISTARRYGGTGLGLAISSTLVNRMGGGLWVESEEGVGSRFALTLPMTIAYGRSAECRGSESTTAGIFASPPSPSSTISDGSGSINLYFGERIIDGTSPANKSVSPGSSSNPSGYFPPTPSSQSSHTQSISDDRLNRMSNQTNAWSSWSQRGQHSEANIHPSVLPFGQSSWSVAGNKNIPHIPNPVLPLSSAAGNTMGHGNVNRTDNKRAFTRPHLADTAQSATEKSISGKAASEACAASVTRPSRAAIVKQQYHYQRKATNSDETFAALYPIKIMLAEDNVLNQKIAISILKRLGYYDVMVASNGREALDLMRKMKFDMDLYMPEMDGLEATRAIISERKAVNTLSQSTLVDQPLLNVTDVYIIALTASASKQDRQICIDAGMNDFISKPFTMMEMKASLKNCISKRKKRRKDQQYGPEYQPEKDDPMAKKITTETETEIEVVVSIVDLPSHRLPELNGTLCDTHTN
ncbi:hypothetical protein EC973_001442 [Apophysomyces ossiformis]|uniref:Uncharacterized protein n=1 Tax=Apophysomyces ossiformis TaxID=679940 RepID=A0A8H7ENK6_9FUNG|nr:hypothetical protein EC973_001442 [Apophysomyces ossiformis]